MHLKSDPKLRHHAPLRTPKSGRFSGLAANLLPKVVKTRQQLERALDAGMNKSSHTVALVRTAGWWARRCGIVPANRCSATVAKKGTAKWQRSAS
jgi:hypothetical protein